MRVSYSEEQRQEAVRTYWRFGSYAKTLRLLGYPSRHVLYGWVAERTKAGTLRKRDENAKHGMTEKQSFTPEQRLQVVLAVLERGMTPSQAAARYGVKNTPVIYQWINVYQQCKSVDMIPRNLKKFSGATDQAGMVRQPPSSQAEATSQASQPGEDIQAKGPTMHQYLASLPDDPEVLKRELAKARATIAAWEELSKTSKKDSGVSPEAVSDREKTQVVNAMRSSFPLALCLEVVNLPMSSYYYHRAAVKRPDKYAYLRPVVVKICEDSRFTYGAYRVWLQLQRNGIIISEKVIRRLMKRWGIQVRYAYSRMRYSSYVGEIAPAEKNLLAGNFHADAPNQVLVTDVSMFPTKHGKVYFSPLIDCFDGKVLAYRVGCRAHESLTLGMLDEAMQLPGVDPQAVTIHSDRGAHYRTRQWRLRKEEYGFTASMSRKGKSGDNARCEGFFGRMKMEMFYGRTWNDPGELMEEIRQYIEFHNHHKIRAVNGLTIPEGRAAWSAIG